MFVLKSVILRVKAPESWSDDQTNKILPEVESQIEQHIGNLVMSLKGIHKKITLEVTD